MSLDDLLEKGSGNVRLNVKIEDDVVLIEGDNISLVFLANIIGEMIRSDIHSLHLNPLGAGNTFFSSTSEAGIYLHLTPCASENPHTPPG